MRKVRFCLFSFVLIIFMLLGCQSQTNYKILYESKETKQSLENSNDKEITKYKIAFVPKVGDIPYFQSVYDGVLEAANEYHVKIIYRAPRSAHSELQQKIVQKVMEEKVDAIAISVIDIKKMSPLLLKAKKMGIKVVTWDSDSEEESRDLFVDMVDAELLGRHLMDQLALYTGESGEFAIMTGSFSATNHNAWEKWVQQQWKEYYPNMDLVEIVSNDDDPKIAYEISKEMLKRHPHLKGIVGISSVGPPAAAKAVKEAQKEGDITIVGLSTPNLMREYLKEGAAQSATLWSPKKLGFLTVFLTVKKIENQPIEDYQVIEQIGTIRYQKESHRVIMGEAIDFTKENVDQYDF